MTIADKLREHLEAGVPASDGEPNFKLHPKGEPFDEIRHPGGYRTLGPDVAFTYHGDEHHGHVGMEVTDLLDKIDREASDSEPHFRYTRDEDGDANFPMTVQSRRDDSGHGWTTHSFETQDGKSWHLEHRTYNSGGNKALGLDGTKIHHVALFER